MKELFIGFKEGFKEFGKDFAIIVNTLLLAIVYLLGAGITSIVAKVLKKRFLDTKRKKSYWTDLNMKKDAIDSYYRQF